jgi:Tfp pilus assembly protein PilX
MRSTKAKRNTASLLSPATSPIESVGRTTAAGPTSTAGWTDKAQSTSAGTRFDKPRSSSPTLPTDGNPRRKSASSTHFRRQRGALTLMLGLLLLMGSTILTLSSVRVGIIEQRIANNEVRAKEAQQAAQAGLDYALARAGRGDAIDNPPAVTATGDATYDIVLTATEDDDETCIRSEANARGDDSITAVATECFQQKRLLSGKSAQGFASDLPPMVINGCLSGATGTPNIYPRDCDNEMDEEECESIALASSADSSCLDLGHLEVNNNDQAVIRPNAFEGSAWDYVFDISKEKFKALAAANDHSSPRLLWITSEIIKKEKWTEKDIDSSPTAPVVLVYEKSAGCPKINGNITIYGIVYVETSEDCNANGWGKTDIYGSMVFEGNVTKLTANTAFRYWGLADKDAEDDDSLDGLQLDRVFSASRIPGSWHDWN